MPTHTAQPISSVAGYLNAQDTGSPDCCFIRLGTLLTVLSHPARDTHAKTRVC